jgi:hypothetical protein
MLPVVALRVRTGHNEVVRFKEDLSMAKRSKPKSGSQPRKRASKKGGRAPSATRQTAEWVTSSLTSPLVREAVAAALIAGAGAAAAVFAGHSGSGAKKKIRSASSVLTDATQDVTDAAVGALAGAATDAVKRLLPAGKGRDTSG